MALLPLLPRDADYPNIAPWRDMDRWLNQYGSSPFHEQFRTHFGNFLRNMDQSIVRMDDEMRRMMHGQLPGLGYNGLDAITPAIIEEKNGQKKAQYSFDVTGFHPSELTIKTRDNTLEVIARHEEKGDGREIKQEFRRSIMIPEGIDPDELQGRLVGNGLLRIEAPYRPPSAASLDERSRVVPIQREYLR